MTDIVSSGALNSTPPNPNQIVVMPPSSVPVPVLSSCHRQVYLYSCCRYATVKCTGARVVVVQVNEVSVVFVQYPDNCCPHSINSCCRCACCDVISQSAVGRHCWTIRCRAYSLVEHRYFETFIIAMIVASSLSLVRRQ